MTGGQTDIDGMYSISAPANAVLVFSSIGYKDQAVPVNGLAEHNVELSPDTEMLEETLYSDNFWGFNEPMRNRAAIVSMFKQRTLSNLQKLPLNDRVIFLTSAEMLNTILLPHKIIVAFLFRDSPHDIADINDINDFVNDLDDYCREIGLTFNLKKKERLDIWEKYIKTIARLFLTPQ